MTAAAYTDATHVRLRREEPPIRVHQAGDWPAFWRRIQERLGQDGYRPGTLRLYRQVLRNLRKFLCDRYGVPTPGGLTRGIAEAYLVHLARQEVSWSWMNPKA